MIGIKPGKVFFDPRKVLKGTEKAIARVLGRFGSFVRRTARQSIRKRKRISAEGAPPSGHTGTLKASIFFDYDPRPQSVIIGPVALPSKSPDSPSALEYGGRSKIKSKRGRRSVKVASRPFMGPALEKEMPKLPAMWADSIR